MYLYSARLRTETSLKGYQQLWRALKEILNGLSAAINALHLVHPASAWIDPLLDRNALHNEQYPSKKARITIEDQRTASTDVHPQTWKSYIDIEKIENEFVLTSAEYLLSLAHVKWNKYRRKKDGKEHRSQALLGTQKAPLELVDLLIQTNSYDMAFTILLRFLKGSELKRGLERVFSAMSLKCCPHIVDSSRVGDDPREQVIGELLSFILTDIKCSMHVYPLIVAETLLRTDSQIELPLWLVKLFKDGRRGKTLGMTGQESNPALLFQLYVDYGRYREATNLLLEYIGSFASMRPSNLMNRKRPFGVWFPYTTIQRLWCQLEEMINSGHMVDQCKQLKDLLHGALLRHLQLVKADSEDALS
ncbi:hypothetical protein M0R45_030981 [Rubus argutus]|uniref:NUP160 C-terminal TPR domain-containing protein n=1 Tax=Rubus argutus TaxID=59490 RepID=A0AAW1WEU9_RUBAR